MPGPALPFDPIAEARRQWEAHGWDEAAAGMAVLTSLTRVAQLLESRVDAVLQPFDLTLARFEVLTLLAFSREGALPMGKLGTRLQVHPASVTSAVARLERQGYARRARSDVDGRVALATLTPAGRDVARRAADVLNREVFADLGLTPSESTALFRVLEKLRREAGDFGPDAAGALTSK